MEVPSQKFYDFALVLDAEGKLGELGAALSDLRREFGPGLDGIELFGQPEKKASVILLRFLFKEYSSGLRSRVELMGSRLRGKTLEPQRLPTADRQELYSRFLEGFPLHLTAGRDPSEGTELFLDQMRHSQSSGRVPIAMEPVSADQLWTQYAKLLVNGEIFVPCAKRLPAGMSFDLQLVGHDLRPPSIVARVERSGSQDGKAGIWASAVPSDSLKAFFARQCTAKQLGRRTRRRGGKRTKDRFVVQFGVKFANYPHLPPGEAVNLSKGGVFVRTFEAPALRSKVRLRLDLPSGPLEIEGQIAHVVTAKQASGQLYSPGVNIAFSPDRSRSQERIHEIIDGYEKVHPLILLAEADPTYANALSAKLSSEAMDVVTAQTAAMVRSALEDRLFDFDLLLFDARLPGFDARGFCDRAANLGGELELRILMVSAAGPRDSHPPRSAGARVTVARGPIDEMAGRIKQMLRNS